MRLKWFLYLAALPALIGLGCNGNGPNDPVGDTTHPTVVSVIPSDGGILDLHNGRIEISATFSEPVDSASVTELSFVIAARDTQPYVEATVLWESEMVFLEPAQQLRYSTTYDAILTTGITDTAGNHLAQNYTWSFTTTADPTTTPPTVIATDPTSGESNVSLDPDFSISITFDKAIDPNTFLLELAPTDGEAIVSVAGKTVTYQPLGEMQYSTEYTATISTATADTFGNHLEEPYSWSFTTEIDPTFPTVDIFSPEPLQIIGDTVTITVYPNISAEVTRVEFYIDGYHVPAADDTTAPWEYLWDASGLNIGSSYTLFVKAYDAQGRVGVSDTVSVIYLWEELLPSVDFNDPWQTDIKRIYARSTDSLLEVRVETWEDWYDPYDTDTFDDTTLDLAMYFDADLSAGTGRTYMALPSHPLNGIGADYQSIVGLHGNDAFRKFNSGTNSFDLLYGPGDLPYYNLPPDTNVFEIGFYWSYFGVGTTAIRAVFVNAFYIEPEAPIFDWFPNEGEGYITIYHQDRYIGATGGTSSPRSTDLQLSGKYPNPFNSVGAANRR